MSVAVSGSSLIKRLEKRIDNNFSAQIELLQKLVKAKSANQYTPDLSPKDVPVEGKVAKLIYGEIKNLGLSPKRMGETRERSNVVCIFGPDRFRKSLILNGHMDTVEQTSTWTKKPFAGVVENNKLYGVGALDMKGTLSAYIFALKALVAEKVKLDGRLILEFVVDEEPGASSQFGTEYLVKKGILAKAAIIGEPGTGKISIGHRGGYRFRLTTSGEAVHTGFSAWEKKEKGRNAVLDMARVIVALQTIEMPYRPARAFPGRIPVFTFPTNIHGGTSINIVPDKCVAEGDVRLMPGNSDKQVRMWMEEAIKLHCPDVIYEIEDLVYVPSVEIAKHEEIVDTLLKNMMEVTGRKPKIAGAGPWNDAWMLVTRGIPTVAGFGPDGENAHGANEYVSLDSLKEVTKIYLRTVVDYLGIKK
ncbi:MAG: ArgE/DapE family deacylase [Patescibacteria group bacterium]